MKRLSTNEVEKESRAVDTVGTQPTANEFAEQSLSKRVNDAAADYAKSGYPAWQAPRLDINAARARAHEQIRKQNAAKQKQD